MNNLMEMGNHLRKRSAVYVLSSRRIWSWSNLH